MVRQLEPPGDRAGSRVAYGSMYGNTKAMAEAVAASLARHGAEPVVLHDVSRTHPSFILADAWRFRGMLLGSATYNRHLFPPVRHLTEIMTHKKMKARTVGIFGSCGWSGGAVKELRALVDAAGWSLVEPVIEVMGAPSAETFEECDLFGQKVAERILPPDRPGS